MPKAVTDKLHHGCIWIMELALCHHAVCYNISFHFFLFCQHSFSHSSCFFCKIALESFDNTIVLICIAVKVQQQMCWIMIVGLYIMGWDWSFIEVRSLNKDGCHLTRSDSRRFDLFVLVAVWRSFIYFRTWMMRLLFGIGLFLTTVDIAQRYLGKFQGVLKGFSILLKIKLLKKL